MVVLHAGLTWPECAVAQLQAGLQLVPLCWCAAEVPDGTHAWRLVKRIAARQAATGFLTLMQELIKMLR